MSWNKPWPEQDDYLWMTMPLAPEPPAPPPDPAGHCAVACPLLAAMRLIGAKHMVGEQKRFHAIGKYAHVQEHFERPNGSCITHTVIGEL